MEHTSSQPNCSTGTGSAMIPIGTHSLYMAVTGIVRHPHDPIVVILAGAELGRSEDGPNRPTAVTAAQELHALLQTIQIPSPLLFVGHYYGVIIAQEYLNLYLDEVIGMILAESTIE
ncbi:hypothetical protein MPDQ_007413 [Monascus purpureus]|uniref:AB hydrolase-1 domain-containing protein n=1 Tax=Monascus purpureus TaxID=5098 RepID=A0A507QWE0_MONPU|nr:hypothetical protein MPDQ_007413 [Monascus purpureus]